MTDRELLEMAAKEAGLSVQHTALTGTDKFMRWDGNGFVPWNPLADDGDALRLATTLCMDIYIDKQVVEANGSAWTLVASEKVDGDRLSATRRAIVRAAAAIAAQEAAVASDQADRQ